MRNDKIKKFIFFLLIFSILGVGQTITKTYPKTDGPDKNPHKGWNCGWWHDLKDASVGFQYIKWKEFESEDDKFDFDYIEKLLQRPGSKGRHFILRLYADWHGEPKSHAPEWLYKKYKIKYIKGDKKYVTDYNDSKYLKQVEQAIKALAAKYDNDPRVYAFQIGVLGFWGEWHNFGINSKDFEIKDSTRVKVIKMYKKYFKKAKIVGRYPWRKPLKNLDWIGYHNDFFMYDKHSFEFDDAIAKAKQWKNGPIGGEMPPAADKKENMAKLAKGAGLKMVEKGRYSTMKPQKAFCEFTKEGEKREAFLRMHRRMGYNFQIDKAVYTKSLKGKKFTIKLSGKNVGVAPIYYDWQVQFALLDAYNKAIEIVNDKTDLTKILPEKSFVYQGKIDVSKLPKGAYKVAVRIIQPGADKEKTAELTKIWNKLDARNVYIEFANKLEVIKGNWNEKCILQGGWSVLGEVKK